MSERPLISVGVTTYDRRELLIRAINSILAQTFADFEIILGNDNPSIVLSRDLLQTADQRVRIVNRSHNLGEISNMNDLLDQARGTYFTWLADDDEYHPNFLESVVDAVRRWPELNCVFTGYASGAWHQPIEVDSIVPPVCWPSRQFLRAYISGRVSAIGCYGVFNRQLLRELGGMERLGSGFSPYSDNLLVLRASQGTHVGYIDSPLVFFRAHAESLSNSSADIEAYRTAQEDFCPKAIKVFRLSHLNADFHRNVYDLLIRWCATLLFHVVFRAHSAERTRHLREYDKFLSQFGADLGAYMIRLKFALWGLRAKYVAFGIRAKTVAIARRIAGRSAN